ncbi:MAG: hypothetical protein IK115_05960 [Lachnospiraceae bacterium]|nr:hypothetical protein [Lachnospiraceae bacterium]
MGFQIVLVVEANEKAQTDYIYIKSILNHVYNIRLRNDIKISPVFMGGKGNYEKVSNKINKLVKAYNYIGESCVIYCFDTDKYDSDTGDEKALHDEMQYCADNGYEFVWFCHDIEEVFLGKSVSNSEKTEKAKSYSARHGVENLNLKAFEAKVMGKKKSNLLLILKKYFEDKDVKE